MTRVQIDISLMSIHITPLQTVIDRPRIALTRCDSTSPRRQLTSPCRTVKSPWETYIGIESQRGEAELRFGGG
jgi:hypothetical protein